MTQPSASSPLGTAATAGPAPALTLTRSRALLEQARELIPGITQSLMKRPEAFAPGEFPVYLEGGEGAVVRDVDGNEYVDYVCGLGANALGHHHPAVLRAIESALPGGLLHSLPGPAEVDAARELVALVPHAEMARFFKTGADATSAALRLARHLTGRERVVTVGYNGWHDHFMFDTPGVPRALSEYTLRMPLMRPEDEAPLLELVSQRGDELAAVLLSLPYNRVVSRAFLYELRDTCREHGVRFVLDEVVTGFRLARGGAQQYYDLAADYVCVSKGLAAGMPLSALVGPRAQLRPLEELQVSTTFGGELLSLAVCRAALSLYRDTDCIERACRLGARLREGVNARARAQGYPLEVAGYDPLPFFRFASTPPEQQRLGTPFVAAMARRGFLLRRDVSFVSGVHTEAQIDATVEAVEASLHELTRQGHLGGGA